MNEYQETTIGKSTKTRLLLVLIIYKVVFFLLAFVAIKSGGSLVGVNLQGLERVNFQGIPSWGKHFLTWDAEHYFRLASNGYIPEDGICAFYPLYPMLIRIFSVFTGGNYFWTGLILSNLFSLIAFYQFYMLVRERYGESAARWALAFLLIFPGAIFFQLIYTESLFLMLVVIFFRRLFKNDFFGAGLCALFLPMTRAIGIFVILPLFLWLWDNKRSLRDYTVLALPLIGYGFYFCIMAYYTGNPFEGFIAQRNYPNQPSISNIFNLGREIREIINIDRFHGGMTSAVDRFHFIIVLLSLGLVWKLDKYLFAYAVLTGVIQGFTHYYWSYPRLMMMCFPVFIAFAVFFNEKQFRWVRWYIAFVMGALWLYFIVLYFNYQWAS